MKHHAGYIISEIDKHAKLDKEKFIVKLKKIGESQMDIYTGRYYPLEICSLLKSELAAINKFGKDEYQDWIKNDYKIITLPDSSFWTLRTGIGERYIHIHPGRYSPFTIRVKASTLKTSIAAIFYTKISKNREINLTLINEVRQKYLSLSPVKSLSNEKGIGKVITLLND